MSHTAIVILNYNGEKFLQQFLPSVIQHAEGATVVVADNGSTDNSLNILHQQFPSVEVIPFAENYGFCRGYNEALKRVKADYYVILNSDIEVTKNWLSPMVALLDSHAQVAAVQPKILAFHQKDTFEYAGAAGGFIDFLGYPFCRGRLFDQVEKDHHQYDDSIPIFWATGACLVIRSSVYHQLGGFDEDFFAHMEEIDLCWKIHRQGYEICYCGESTVYHVGAGTLGYGHPRKTYLNFRNGLTLVYKHFTAKELYYKFPIRILLDGVAALKFLLSGETAHTQAILKAHYDFWCSYSRNTMKRRYIQTSSPTYDRHTIYDRSILWQYFLKNHKEYRTLDRD
jgi:GT2 family glycosyltransferase